MKVEVLGPGCRRCEQLYENTVAAVSAFDPSYPIEIEKVTDIKMHSEWSFASDFVKIEGREKSNVKAGSLTCRSHLSHRILEVHPKKSRERHAVSKRQKALSPHLHVAN